MTQAKVRLHVEQALAVGQPVALAKAQANYLVNVMRLGPGDAVLLFNGRDGEYLARVVEAGKRRGALLCEGLTAALRLPPDLWLLVAPIKRDRMQFIVEKAVELGVARILPVQTRFTNERIRLDKLQAHALEAAEQCGATFVPEVAELVALERVLAAWPVERRLLWCDEALAGQAVALGGVRGAPWAILIGPEGGFAPEEQVRLRAMAQVVALSLGPRILRADTAAVAALTLWQAALGDWV